MNVVYDSWLEERVAIMERNIFAKLNEIEARLGKLEARVGVVEGRATHTERHLGLPQRNEKS